MRRGALVLAVVLTACEATPETSSDVVPPARGEPATTVEPARPAHDRAAEPDRPDTPTGALLAALSSDDEDEADRAADALRALGADAVRPLVVELGRRKLRRGAAVRIGEILDEIGDASVVPALVDVLWSRELGDPNGVVVALSARARTAPPAFDALLDAAFEPAETYRQFVAQRALVLLADEDALAPEVEAAARKHEARLAAEIRPGADRYRVVAACSVLATVADAERAYALIRQASEGLRPGRRRSLDEPIGRICRRAAEPLLARILAEGDVGVRRAAVQGARERRPDAPPLRAQVALPLLADPDERVAIAAAFFLGEMTHPDDEHAVAALRRAAESPRERPARAAAIALADVLARK